MKKIYLKNYISFLFMLFSLAILFFIIYFYFFYKINTHPAWTSNTSFIGHAFYGIDSIDYTNCYEAFELAYQKGIRVMEVDFSFTSDQKLVLVHFWNENTPFSSPVSWKEFINSKINKKYTPMDLETLLQIMKKYPDLYIIIDSKEENYLNVYKKIVETCQKYDNTLLNRFIVQLYQFSDYEKIKQIYPFSSYILTLYKMPTIAIKQITYFCLLHHIEVIALPIDFFNINLVTEKDIQFIKSKNIKIYIYTINDIKTYDSLTNLGIDGVYTDFLY